MNFDFARAHAYGWRMKRFLAGFAALLVTSVVAQAGLFDFLFKKKGSADSATLAGFSEDQLAQALKDALGNGIQSAITNLGREGGFLHNPKVRIPMPEKLQSVEKTLRALQQDKYADQFVAAMNHAAERAVPVAAPIFTDAIKSMTIADAKGLVTGGDDSATRFFQEKSEQQLQEKFLPIVKEATAQSGVTAAYKKLFEQVGPATSLFGRFDTSSLDIDRYVTQEASDGLFQMIAEEEKRIRENPAARTTELLQKVFGTVKAPER